MTWAGLVFFTGWVLRCLSSYHPANVNLYISQSVLILAGPPIYSATAYNVLGRLMRYLPMHAPLHPGRVMIVFIYLGVAVESLTAAGASNYATASIKNPSKAITGGTLLSISLVLQGGVEIIFASLVVLIHRRCVRHRMLTPNVRAVCIMLYGTSTLCLFIVRHEWYLYVFEGAPMVLYTFWINLVHPGRLLPSNPNRYLDFDAVTERDGPGWIDTRSQWETFVDPLDLGGTLRGRPAHEAFWLKVNDWPVAEGGSFALGTATNVKSK
jgi:hypothetical protein